MSRSDSFRKQQQIFFKMTPYQLRRYVQAHPQHSLPAGVMNARFRVAAQVLMDTAKVFPNQAREDLVTWVKTTFNRSNIIVSPQTIQGIYATHTKDKEIQSAVVEFVVFAGSPMTNHVPNQIQEFVRQVAPAKDEPVKVTPKKLIRSSSFARGMDAYRQATCLFSHS